MSYRICKVESKSELLHLYCTAFNKTYMRQFDYVYKFKELKKFTNPLYPKEDLEIANAWLKRSLKGEEFREDIDCNNCKLRFRCFTTRDDKNT